MINRRKRPLVLAIGAALGVTTAMGSFPAFAQDDEQGIEETVVTGSRIQKANLVSSSPVTQLDNEQLQLTGLTRIEDAMAAIPAVSLDQSSGQAIESNGTATLQLRNLGTTRTLVLMNGRRLPVGSPSSGSSAADINLIPGALVERVEVLTGGASTAYGADAVAGVVNFLMVDDFEGIQINTQFSQFRHDNDGNVVASAAEAGGYPYASGSDMDGDISELTFVLGSNFGGDRGNATLFATYREIEGVTQINRDYSACPVRASLSCLGSSTNASGTIIPLDPNGIDPVTSWGYRVEGNELLEGIGPGFNFAAPSYFQRPDERTVIGTFAHYDVTDRLEVYTELMFMDTKSTTQFGPAGNFFTPLDTNCGNPYLSAQQATILGCSGDDPSQMVSFLAGRRNVEGGPRFADMRHTTNRALFGVRGDLNDAWRYDVSYQYSEVDMSNRSGNYFDTARLNQALDATLDSSGNVVCLPGAAAGCAPYNLWNTGGVDAEQVAFLSQEWYEKGRTAQTVAMGYVQGSLGEYGIRSPFANNGIEIVAGLEYREEVLEYDVSDNAKAGTVGGLGAAIVPVAGRYDVTDFYVEASVPVVEDAPLAQSIVLDLGYRYSDYSTGQTTDTYKFAGSWEVNPSVKFRGSYQRAVRAPNVVDLFQPVAGGLFAMDADPCSKAAPGDSVSTSGYTYEQCARTGVSQAVWDMGGPANNPASQYNTIGGGSTELKPEEADTVSLGFILTPEFAPGLAISVDWYDIEVEDAISSVNAETTLIQCLETGDAAFCDSVGRGLNDTLWLGLAAPGNGVDARSTNIGFYAVEGVDVELNYSFDIGGLGTINLANIAGFVMSLEQEEYPGAGIIECEGIYGGSCGIPTPELKNRFQATWMTPWNLTASLTWRYIDGVSQEFTSSPNDIDDFNYFDISAIWSVTDYATVRAGINNVFDEEPPFVYQGVTARENGNTYPGIYDPLGQYMFVGVTFQF
ncbi:MAG: TonB-dependent receptor [Proteobacteria bacterium]|nr:TonB-dependent receptor [Pseudomonadota bacterium]